MGQQPKGNLSWERRYIFDFRQPTLDRPPLLLQTDGGQHSLGSDQRSCAHSAVPFLGPAYAETAILGFGAVPT